MKKVDINESRAAQFFMILFFVLLFTVIPAAMIGTYVDTSKLFDLLILIGIFSMLTIGLVLKFTVK